MRGLRAGVGGCRTPAAPCLPPCPRRGSAPAMPCVADWLNNPFSIVQGIFGERGPGGAGAAQGPSGRAPDRFSSRAVAGPGAENDSPGGRALPPLGGSRVPQAAEGISRPSPAAPGPVLVP